MKEWYGEIDLRYEQVESELQEVKKDNERMTSQIESLTTSLQKRKAINKGDVEQFKSKLEKIVIEKEQMKKKYEADIEHRV